MVAFREKTKLYGEEECGSAPSLLKMASKERREHASQFSFSMGCYAAIVRCCLSHKVFKMNMASLEGMPLRNLVSQVVCKVFASP